MHTKGNSDNSFTIVKVRICNITLYTGLSEVVKRVSAGLARGNRDFGLQAQMILIAFYKHPDWDMKDVLRLCQTHWDHGVVGLDLCTLQPPSGITGGERSIVVNGAMGL